MDLIKNDLKLRKPFRVIYGGDDDGIYYYDDSKNIYQGEFGYITMEGMIEAIKHMEICDNYFIQLMVLEESNDGQE